MSVSSGADRRKHARCPLAMSVSFQHLPSHRDFPARCVDISRGGMMMYIPATAPVQAGHPIRLTLKDMNLPELEDLSGKTVDAHIIHVNRKPLIPMGHLAMGVQFD